MLNSNIGFRLGKSAGFILCAISIYGIMIDRVDAKSYLNLAQSNGDINSTEIKIFCSTVVEAEDIKQSFPQLTIETELLADLDLEGSEAIATTCPDAKKVFIVKASDEDGFIVDRNQIIETITKFYIQEGYINSRAIPYGDQDILIDEGKVDVIVEGSNRIKKYVRNRITPAANPFNTKDIEDRLRLLQNDPLIDNIEATLRPNEETNTSELIVNVTAAKLLFGNVGVDNFSPPSVGPEKLNFDLGFRNLTGIGDTFAIAYKPRIEAFNGTYNLDFNYQAPLNSKNGTLNLRAAIDRNKIINQIGDAFDITGKSERYSLNYRQPVILNPRQELALSVGFTYRDGQTFLLQDGFPFGVGPDEDGVSRTSVLNFGQDYTLRDSAGAWGFRSLFRVGLDIFDATDNEVPDENGDYPPDGQFFSWLAQTQRVQVLNQNNFLIIQADIQLTPHSLLASEQFSIGGGQSVRGYRQNVRSGDNGIRFLIEDRITLARNDAEDSVFVVAPFFNLGAVWNVANNPNQVPDQNFIAALGLGLLWQPVEGLNLRVDYAPPLIDLRDRGNNVQDDGLNFSVNYSF